MNKSRDEKQTVAQKETKCLVLKTGAMTLAERNESAKDKETKLTIKDSDILVDTEKGMTGWKEDQRRPRSRSEEERSERSLHSALPTLVMLRAGERYL